MAKKLEPVPSRTVLVTKIGAKVNGTQANATSINVHGGAKRFEADNRCCLASDGSVYFRVVGEPSNDTVLTVSPAIDVTDGDIIINLGNDGGVSAPRYNGADSMLTIYSEPTTSGDTILDNKVTTNVDGEYEFYVRAGLGFDVTIMDADGAISSNSQTIHGIRLAGIDMKSDVPDSGTNVAWILDCAPIGGSTKLLSVRNSTTERFSVNNAGNTAVAGTLAVTGATTLTGAATAASTLAVTGAATLASTLGVTGASTLTGNVSCGGTLGVTGATALSSTLGVTGAATLSSTVDVTSTATFKGPVSLGNTSGSVADLRLFDGVLAFNPNIGVATEEITLSTGGTTTDSTSDLLPANAIILAVIAQVTTTITTATDWKVGDPTTATRFTNANGTMTSGTQAFGVNHWLGSVSTDAAGPTQSAAAKVRITTTGTPGAGKIRVSVYYMQGA